MDEVTGGATRTAVPAADARTPGDGDAAGAAAVPRQPGPPATDATGAQDRKNAQDKKNEKNQKDGDGPQGSAGEKAGPSGAAASDQDAGPEDAGIKDGPTDAGLRDAGSATAGSKAGSAKSHGPAVTGEDTTGDDAAGEDAVGEDARADADGAEAAENTENTEAAGASVVTAVTEPAGPLARVHALRARVRNRTRFRGTAWEAAGELLLVAALFLVYKLGRGLSAGDVSDAMRNAQEVLTLQHTLRLPDEAALQSWVMQSHGAIVAANKYYAYVHFPATVAFLLWLWIRHRDHYRWIRNVLAIMTGVALVIHILVPLAPPRMMGQYGFVDTGMLLGDSPYSGAGSKIANQYAAMPSLHFGWAVVVAIGVMAVWAAAGPWRRWAGKLIWLHPAITLFVITVTANHYWLDAIVSLLLLAVATAIVPFPDRSPHARLVRIIPAPRVPAR